MEASDPLKIDGMEPLELLKARGLGIRSLFRISILIVVALASIALAVVSFTNVTAAERERAEVSVRSEINYLCLQLESLEEHAGTFEQNEGSGEVDAQQPQAGLPYCGRIWQGRSCGLVHDEG